MLVLNMKFSIRLKHMQIVAEIFVIPRNTNVKFCGHHS